MSKYNDIIKEFQKNIENTVNNIAKGINEYVLKSGMDGVILGMSGGIDCSVVARLCQKANVPVLLVLMPNGDSMNLAGDIYDSIELIKKFDFKYINCPITRMSKSVVNGINNQFNPSNLENKIELSEMAISNINPRLRMTVLYTLAQSLNCLVIGTGNKSEITMGYFTKFGDGSADLNPLADFTKSEVILLGRYLDLPERIVTKPPSANLWAGQTDEDEMGITYYDLDNYILTGEGTDEVITKVENTKKKVAHKINPIPYFKK